MIRVRRSWVALTAISLLAATYAIERISADEARIVAQPPVGVSDGAGLVAQRGGPGRGPGFGRGKGPPPGKGPAVRPGQDDQFAADHEVFFFLLENRDAIKRTIKDLPNGVETVTESADQDVAGKIQEHVAAMYARVEKHRPIHLRDPLFAEIFRNADKIKIKSEDTPQGIKVVETSEDPYVAKLIQAHAQVVSLFIKNGHAEMRKNHALPPR